MQLVYLARVYRHERPFVEQVKIRQVWNPERWRTAYQQHIGVLGHWLLWWLKDWQEMQWMEERRPSLRSVRKVNKKSKRRLRFQVS